MFGLWRVKFYLKRRKWRKLNSHNETFMVNDFRFEKVSVEKKSYGNLYVIDFSPSDTKLKIGAYCSIAGGVKFLLGGEHNTNTVSTYPFKVKCFGEEREAGSKGDIVVEDDVWIGENALICSGVTIGQGAVVAAGAIVTKDVEPYAIVGGNPARLIRYRLDENLRRRLKTTDVAALFDLFVAGDMPMVYGKLDNGVLESILSIQNLKQDKRG